MAYIYARIQSYTPDIPDTVTYTSHISSYCKQCFDCCYDCMVLRQYTQRNYFENIMGTSADTATAAQLVLFITAAPIVKTVGTITKNTEAKMKKYTY